MAGQTGRRGEEGRMNSVMKKLSSRKLWAAVAGLVAGLAMVFGLDEGIITTVSGAVVTVASVIIYIVTEGRVDAAAVKKAAEDVAKAGEAIENQPEGH